MRAVKLLIVSLFFLAAAGTSPAQVMERKSLSLSGARQVIAAAVAEAEKLKAPGGVIAVVVDGGHLIALERLDNTFAAGADISVGKARTAVLFKRPSRVFEEIIAKSRTSMVTLPNFTPLQGGIPIMVDGQVVGGVGVSGAASAQQDEEIAIAGANAAAKFPSMNGAKTSEVSYFEREKVSAAFAKGAVLFDGSDKYMVHASRRDGPGMAEVHLKDADIIYVQEGSANFVTGGSVVDPKTVATDEIRGPGIEGGNARKITKGDVIIVPAGTPHWFKEVSAPLTYYVVKSR